MAQQAIAVGPPASTASRAMTITLTEGCRSLMVERESFDSWEWTTTSSNPIRQTSAIVHSP
jgi:hypothetical protein